MEGAECTGDALLCGPETSVTSPLQCNDSSRGAPEDLYPVIEAVGMWQSRRDFQRVWEGWEAGFMAFHAFHTLSFPWSALEARIKIRSFRNPVSRALQSDNPPALGLFRVADQPGVIAWVPP